MTLSEHVRTLGRGPGRSRSLTMAEAQDAMSLMLDDAAPEAVGALLMLLRMKGETADEIAGFAAAAQSALPPLPQVDLDWPAYAAGRTRGLPWFLLSARLVADAGHRVLLHGWNGRDEAVRAHLDAAGIPLATPDTLSQTLDAARIAYIPLETLHPGLFRLLRLREVLGLRSCVNTVCRMLNPARARASVQGVFHPSYRLLQADAAARLSLPQLTVIKGGGGEFERHPGKAIEAFGLRDGALFDHAFPALGTDKRRLTEVTATTLSGAAQDPLATDIVTGTAALALETLGVAAPLQSAETLWQTRLDASRDSARRA